MHRPFNGFNSKFISFQTTKNSKTIVEIRILGEFLFFMPLNYELIAPLDVPTYAYGQGIMLPK